MEANKKELNEIAETIASEVKNELQNKRLRNYIDKLSDIFL